MVNYIGMRILRCAKYQLVVFKNVDKTGIAADDRACKINDSIQYRMQRIGGCHAASNLMQEIDSRD
jgi:hypothetical protein